jgi:uncharacterized protein
MQALDENLLSKIGQVETYFDSKKSVLIAFSGGTDSSLVAFLARRVLGERSAALTAVSPSMPKWDLDTAKRVAGEISIKHIIVESNELTDPRYKSNPPNRCFFCKGELSRLLFEIASKLSYETLVDGTNAEDLQGHRPGAAALREAGVERPLADAGFTKAEVREAARFFGISTWNKPSSPCLSSRVQYGLQISEDILRRIEEAELGVMEITGVKVVRVRHHGNLARIEVGRNERALLFDDAKLDEIHSRLRSLGYAYVTFDLAGYRTGSMNEPDYLNGTSANI